MRKPRESRTSRARERRQFGVDPEPQSEYDFVNDTTLEEEDVIMHMKPWAQRLVVGVISALIVSGISAFSYVTIENNQTATRIEQAVKDMSDDFDRFVEIRYQSDTDSLRESIADTNRRIDNLRDGDSSGN